MKKSLLLLTISAALSVTAAQANTSVVAAYFADWQYDNEQNPYTVQDIPAADLSHIIYAFLSMCGPHTGATEKVQAQVAKACEGKAPYTAIVVDTKSALEEDFGAVKVKVPYQGHFAQLKQLKADYPHLRILPSFGGWTMSEPFHAMAKDPKSIEHFSKTAVELIKQYDFFDGIDIDWEYPGGGGLMTSPWDPATALSDEQKTAEKAAYTVLVKSLRGHLDALAKQTKRTYDLSGAIGVGGKAAQIDWQAAAPYMTNIFAMTYDFLGGWGEQTGHLTNLHANERSWWGMGADVFINQMIELGIPAEKLVVGATFFGRGWEGTREYNGGLPTQDLTSEKGATFGTDPDEPGYFMYWDLMKNYTDKQGYSYHYDKASHAPYLWNSEKKVFISFDDENSITAKGQWAKKNKLGGIFTWELSGDPSGKLVKAMKESIK